MEPFPTEPACFILLCNVFTRYQVLYLVHLHIFLICFLLMVLVLPILKSLKLLQFSKTEILVTFTITALLQFYLASQKSFKSLSTGGFPYFFLNFIFFIMNIT